MPGVELAPGPTAPRFAGRAVAPGQGGATPTLPPAVAQRATLIQQGKVPVPPSAAINPAVRTGLPGARRPDRNAERDAAGECAGRAAFEPALAEDQRAAGSRRQGRATRASERRGIAAGRSQSEREACAGRDAAGISGSGRSRRGSRPAVGATAPAAPADAEPGVPGPHRRQAPDVPKPRVVRRHPAPPRRRSRPLRSRRDLSRSPKFGVRRHRPRCTWRGAAAGCPRRSTAHRRGWRRLRRGWLRRRHLGWPRRRHPHRGWLHRRPAIAAPPPPPRMAAPPPRPAAPAPAGGSQESARRTFRNADGSADRTGVWPDGGPKSPGNKARKLALFPCFWLESGYTPRHLTRKHGSKGRPVAAGP